MVLYWGKVLRWMLDRDMASKHGWVLNIDNCIVRLFEDFLAPFFKPLYLVDNVWSTGAMDRRSIDQRIPIGSKYEPCKNSKLADLFRGNTII